ncbi:glycerophosphoryl diester phosphodiesterase [Enterococcus sp. 7F3_DIV0205]|uniref:Glycerophosphoryl diester phosphodiesterase n=1 Tax=Candidatus Enterococcus palustris TaxID=1834189 RepID=A0AAQ3WAX2_9ENTE|nr:glycerophosphodiester phosphodiesterase family protein [Enterococcus sp. 7F3_DIV0205]OTN85409.1 hypothetical protein A5821_001355 [Enterococcus sp. 7F3_DIV0205]
MEKKKREKKKRKLFRLPTLFILLILGGIAFLFWYYYNLDYQDNATPSYNGYQVSPIDLEISGVDFHQGTEPLLEGSRVNSEFAEPLIDPWPQDEQIKQPATLPVFRLWDMDNKQTVYKASVNLSSVKHIEKVEFPTFGEENGPNDLQIYPAKYHPESSTWETDILVKNHQEAGRYQIKLLITKENGKTELVDFGEFVVEQPSIEAAVDNANVGKGQFDVNIQTKSTADIEKVLVPVWSKEDKSDKKVYEGTLQPDNTYKVHVDYEDFAFNNGLYHASAQLITMNGLKAECEAGTAEIELRRPVRIRIMQETTLFQNRTLSKTAKQLPANSMAYVKGIVFNSEKKVYRTTEGYISAENIEISEMMDDIRYVAHRGNHKVAPENSIPSFQQSDSWGIETDIWLTKDKQWVIMHDRTVDRMTNGKGKISDLTLAQIKALRIDQGSNKENYSQEQLIVPTLEEFLTIMNNKQSIPFIEVKAKNLEPSDYDHLANLITSYGMSNTAVIISFDYPNLVEMKKRLPDTQVQLLAKTLDEQMITQTSSLGGKAGLDIKYDSVVNRPDLIAKAQSKGLSVNLWGVPQNEFKKMEALGINNLTTDYD